MPRPRERGQALLVLMAMMSIAVVLLVYGSTSEVARAVKAEHRTRAVLEQAKQALIGRAVADANRPGSLPCPDNDDDGSADLFVGSNCRSYLGRLPWRTLGIGDLRDETGERLWYALSPNFRDHPGAPALNSDTKGTITVYGASDATVITTQAVAVIFAPGVALPGQRRDASPALCSTTVKTVQRDRCAANYLDTAANVNNAAPSGPYITASETHVYNDKLAVVVTQDLIPLVERRVALEARNALLAYKERSACACYPWADSGSDGASDSGVSRGRIPAVAALPQNWGAGMLPAYFAANGWARVIHYAVGRSALESAGKDCSTCTDASLSVDGASGYDLVLITPGYAGDSRPRVSWSDYLDDAENRNGDDRFVTPLSAAADRDHIYTVAGAATGCSAIAAVLIDNAPCGAPGNSVRSVCRSASAALAGCRCAGAADMMVKSPCANTLDAAPCEPAMTQLRACAP